MEKNTLTFDNAGFSYDISNPTQQTEELSYILKKALLATSPLNIRQETDEEWVARVGREVDIAGGIQELYEGIDAIEACLVGLAADINALTDADGLLASMSNKLQNVGDQLENFAAIFYPSEEENLLSSLSDIAASAGIFLDAPGLSIIDKPELQ